MGPVFILKNFPEYTSPFWNMRRNDDKTTANKIDVILSGMETIGSAERSIDIHDMITYLEKNNIMILPEAFYENWENVNKYYIETEVDLEELTSGNVVTIRMNAIDKFTGDKTSAEVMRSQPFRTDNWSKLVELALKEDGKLERFFSLLNNEFAKIRETGRTITVKIEVKETSPHRLDNEVGDDFDYLSDLIINWVKENSYKNYSRTKGSTSTLLYFDEIKIPLRDKEGMNYDINTFATEMRKQLRRLGKITESGELKVEQDIKGSNILFTIL